MSSDWHSAAGHNTAISYCCHRCNTAIVTDHNIADYYISHSHHNTTDHIAAIANFAIYLQLRLSYSPSMTSSHLGQTMADLIGMPICVRRHLCNNPTY